MGNVAILRGEILSRLMELRLKQFLAVQDDPIAVPDGSGMEWMSQDCDSTGVDPASTLEGNPP